MWLYKHTGIKHHCWQALHNVLCMTGSTGLLLQVKYAVLNVKNKLYMYKFIYACYWVKLF